MKRFQFSLERVRQWREKQVTIEEAKLERLFAELSSIRAAQQAIVDEQRSNDESVVSAAGVTSLELRALDEFRRFARAERERLAQLEIDCSKRISEQQRNILEARRRCQLLDRLKDQKRRAWAAEFDRELEAQASEAHLGKWNAEAE